LEELRLFSTHDAIPTVGQPGVGRDDDEVVAGDGRNGAAVIAIRIEATFDWFAESGVAIDASPGCGGNAEHFISFRTTFNDLNKF